MERNQLNKIAELLGERSWLDIPEAKLDNLRKAEEGMEALLSLFGEDYSRDGLQDTPVTIRGC